MREKDARRLVVTLLSLALLSTWWEAVSLHGETSPQQGHLLLTAPSSDNRNVTTLKVRTPKRHNSTKPFFVLHVGPPKTATTSIQCALEAASADLAQEDSYYFVGKRCPGPNGTTASTTMGNGEEGIPGHHLMMGLINANPNSRGFEALKSRMDFHLSRGNNMIMSLEAMSNHLEDRPETWKLFLSLFEEWHVRIVVSYRHYFDWIRSMYFQQHIGKKYQKLWPHQKGLAIPLFNQFLEYHLERWSKGDPSNNAKSWGQHLTLYAVRYFSKHFEDVRVFDLHQEGDILTNFVCQMMPAADTMCHRLQSKIFREATVQRESHSFDADLLAFAAYESGMLHKDISRLYAVQSFERHLQTTNDLSDPTNLACLSEELTETFLNASIWFEQKVAQSISTGGDLGAFFKRNASDHKALFEKASNAGKFCEVNTESILKLERWREFMKGLKSSKRNTIRSSETSDGLD